jgi:hypothetical protein
MTNNVGTGNSLSGQSGDMPIDMYLRKIEQSCMYENPYQIEDYQRSLMKDFRPDEPFFESDQPRGGVDKNGTSRGGYQSTEVINLRSGARTLDDPYLEDGTFTDWQFLEKDERGIVLEPDMKKHVDQQFARGKFVNFYDDSDNSIPGKGITPLDMQMNIRNAQNVTKDYFKIFDTSFDGWSNSGKIHGFNKSKKDVVSDDQVIKDPSHHSLRTRSGATNNLSNDTSIGWRKTVDHRFKVAKYGRTNVGKSFTSEDWWKNRANVIHDHDKLVSWQNNNINQSLALLMIDLSKQKELKRFTGLNGINYDESKNNKNVSRKLTPADMSGIAKRQSKESQDETPHSLLKGEIKPSSGKKLIIHDVKNIEKTHINPTIVEKMSNINRQTIKKSSDDLRNSIKQSSEDFGIYIEDITQKKVNTTDPSTLWNSLIMYKKGKSKVVNNYKIAVHKVESGGQKLKKISKDIDFKESYLTNQRKGKFDSKSMDRQSTKIDNDYGKETIASHMVGSMGSKYMTSYMDTDSDIGELNDVSGFNKSFKIDTPYNKKNYTVLK